MSRAERDFTPDSAGDLDALDALYAAFLSNLTRRDGPRAIYCSTAMDVRSPVYLLLRERHRPVRETPLGEWEVL